MYGVQYGRAGVSLLHIIIPPYHIYIHICIITPGSKVCTIHINMHERNQTYGNLSLGEEATRNELENATIILHKNI